jgi:squalene-hopene/tetraprenyl-beta-curcumene cyclase
VRTGFFFAVALVAGCGACGKNEPAPATASRIDAALSRAAAFLLAQQSPDGAFRSRTYGTLNDGPALTPFVLKALLFGPPAAGGREACEKAVAYLCGLVRADGTVAAGPQGLGYPVYTAALCVLALTRVETHEATRARATWLAILRGHQLTEELGWQPQDAAYGGWGYSVDPPRRSALSLRGGAYDSDLSSTLFALGALRAAGVAADDPAVRKALVFVERCQNFPHEGAALDESLDDGGFFFTPTNEVQNKAGVVGTDCVGRTRYRSYGSATADGLRALLACGLGAGNPRVVAARKWLEDHFTVDTNPGRFADAREVERDASYFYYLWSLAHALRALGVTELETGGKRISWAKALAEELLARQRPDGTWKNELGGVKEDDPIIATGFAVAALGISRLVIGG